MRQRRNILLGIVSVLSLMLIVRVLVSSSSVSTPTQGQSTARLRDVAADPSKPIAQRQGALALLATRDSRGVQQVQQITAESEEPAIRSHGLIVLSDVADTDSMDMMLDGLTDESSRIRQAANVAVTRMLGGLKISVQSAPGGQTESDRRRQAEYYRNLWRAAQTSDRFDDFRNHQQGK